MTGLSAGVHAPLLPLADALSPLLSELHAASVTRTAARATPKSLRIRVDIRSPFDRSQRNRGEWTASGGPVNRKECCCRAVRDLRMLPVDQDAYTSTGETGRCQGHPAEDEGPSVR